MLNTSRCNHISACHLKEISSMRYQEITLERPLPVMRSSAIRLTSSSLACTSHPTCSAASAEYSTTGTHSPGPPRSECRFITAVTEMKPWETPAEVLNTVSRLTSDSL